MNFLMFLKQGLSSIWANKLRSALSILGIVIGISSVVVMLAIGEGTKQSILSSFDNIDNLITIEKKYTWNEVSKGTYTVGVAESYTSVKEVITMEIADILAKRVFGIQKVAYTANTNIWEVNYNSKPLYGEVLGISKDFMNSKGYKVRDGSYFSNNNYDNNDKVVILGYELVKETFAGENPIGKTIFLGGSPFIVQGIMEKKNWQTDWVIYIPITTAVNRLGAKDLQKIEVFTDKRLSVEQVKKDLQYFLFKNSGVMSPSEVKFTVRTNEDALKQVNEIIGQMKLLLGAIGSIALIVGGIGIMNIMLVSVTERTREIGIRKAIGATKLNIMTQFLVESVILSMLGCIIAIGLCYIIVYFLTKFAGDGFGAVITSSVLIMASCVSVGMGIIFGIMPAWKAARLKPIDALRYE